MNIPNTEIAVVITSPNESLERTVSLSDRDALKKLKKRVTNILNDAIDAAPEHASSRSGLAIA
ncbi:MAG: hypothetical protein WA208_17225 [Thermoanaerobaculia bacterium]